MFTGLVEEVGRVERVERRAGYLSLWMRAERVLAGTKLGDSLCHDGVCLTVAELRPPLYRCDISAETARVSTLGARSPGDPVNLERALAVGDRLGGHLVQGHVDGIGTVAELTRGPDEAVLRITAPDALRPYLAPKGSVAVDGVSLTTVDVEAAGFTVSVIPHTLEVTTLGARRAGDAVNLEVDLLARYVVAALSARSGGAAARPGGMTWAWLAEQGFE